MRLNLSEEWYAREFRKDAGEPAVSVAAGRANAQAPLVEEPTAQADNKHVQETVPQSTQLPPNNI